MNKSEHSKELLNQIGKEAAIAGRKLAITAKECKCSIEKLSKELKELNKRRHLKKPVNHKRLSSRVIK